jgi:hypothetical protein
MAQSKEWLATEQIKFPNVGASFPRNEKRTEQETDRLSIFVDAFAKLRKAIISVVLSVRLSARPRKTTRLPTDGFWSNFSFMITSRWILFKIRNICKKKVVENIKIYILCSVTYFRKSCLLWDNVEKCGGVREAVDNITHARCTLDK